MMRPAVMKAIFSRNHAVRSHLVAGACRGSHPRQPGRSGRSVPRSVRARAGLRRTRRHRRALPVGLHAGAEHGARRSHLRDPQGDTGISRGAIGRRARPDVRRAGSIRTCAGGLSGRSPGLDSPPRRLELAPAAVCAGASSRRSIRPAGRRSLLHRAVDHPGNPNWSTHMPKPLEKKVFPNGMLTLPPLPEP